MSERHWHASDAFCQPRCKKTAIHLPIGEWEYRSEVDPEVIADLVNAGWCVVQDDGPRTLLKYTHWERIE